MDANNCTNEQPEYGYAEVHIPRRIRFWLLLSFNIPASLCTLFLLYHLLFKRTLRQALHNHVIIILLFVAITIQLIDINSYIVFTHIGYVWLQVPFFCDIWSFIDIGLFDMIAILMAWAAIERHILIFHSQSMNTKRRRLLFHYLPTFLLTIYCCLFRSIVIFFPSCQTYYDYSEPWCGFPCYYDQPIVSIYDVVFNYIIPILLIIVFNISLIIRHIHQKRRVQRVIKWRKHRRMILQLLSICLLHLIFFFPILTLIVANYCGVPLDIVADAELYFYFFSYFNVLLLPYVCLISLPKIWKKFSLGWMRHQLQRINIVTPLST